DRLLIRASIGLGDWDPRAAYAADSLATRYPRDPEALIVAAQVVWPSARTRLLLNAAIAIDSAAGMQPRGVCRMCDALRSLGLASEWADSMAAAESTFRRWIRLRPSDHESWLQLGDMYIAVGRQKDATAAIQRGVSLGQRLPDPTESSLVFALRLD